MQKRLTAAEITTLVNDHYGAMVSYARRWSGMCAEDVVQSVFLNLVRFNHDKGRPENPVFWLYRAIRNEAVSQWRKESRRKTREKQAAADNFTISFVRADAGSKGEPIAENWISKKEREGHHSAGLEAEEVGRALARLEPDLREAVYLRIWGGLTFDEIAQITEQTRSAVFRAYQEGLRRLKRDFD